MVISQHDRTLLFQVKRTHICTFKVMFFDSNIIKNYSCGRPKLAYLITFGIVPSFTENLNDAIREKDMYSISFDDAFNKPLQQDQIDVIACFWQGDWVVSRYFGSEFLDHTKAIDLLEALKKKHYQSLIHLSW